jgi:hypothetical protein
MHSGSAVVIRDAHSAILSVVMQWLPARHASCVRISADAAATTTNLNGRHM